MLCDFIDNEDTSSRELYTNYKLIYINLLSRDAYISWYKIKFERNEELQSEWLGCGGSKGGAGDAPPSGSKFFHFQFLGKIWPNNRVLPHLGSWQGHR